MNQDDSPQTWGTELVISDEGQFPVHVFLVFQDGCQSFMKRSFPTLVLVICRVG